jgi:hypothetical protein
MFIKKCDFTCIKILAKCDTHTEYVYTVVTSLLLVFDYHARNTLNLYYLCWNYLLNQRLPGACNRSPGSKLLSITTQLHCGNHIGGRAWLPDTNLEEDHPMTIPSKFGFNWAIGSRWDGFYVNFPQGPMLN